MATRARDWLRQAQRDLEHARRDATWLLRMELL